MSKKYYFFVYYPRSKKENDSDIDFVEPKDKTQVPECLYTFEDAPKDTFYYYKIFKAIKTQTKEKKSNICHYEFIIGEEMYIIKFNTKGGSIFIFDVDLKFGKEIIPIRRKIEQTDIKYNEELNYFIEALKAKEEESMINELYKDTLELYQEKKLFSLLITLFIKIYEKDLCSKLLKKFKEMNTNINKGKKVKETNMARKSYLKYYTSIFNQIISKSEKLIVDNNYNAIKFYGILLCYLNYDYENFNFLLDKLYKKRPKDLFYLFNIDI